MVDRCQLKPTGIGTITGVGGGQRCYTYFIDLEFPGSGVVSGITVAAIPFIPGADVLIGMDIIGRGDLAISNYEGQTMLSFRVPSQGPIDLRSIR